MNFSSLFHWWEEWQLRVLVLGSLLLQFLLVVTSRLRSGRPGILFRSSVWLAYLATDALAIYALATLFNRQKLPKGGGTSGDLEILWAPVLLAHLGGQHPMTAYSIEDNELWKRHIMTLVSQVTVTIYVFKTSWPRGGDKMLLHAAIPLFVVGIFRFIQKPVALKRASIASLMTSTARQPRRPTHHRAGLSWMREWLFTDFVTLLWLRQDRRETETQQEDSISLKDYVERAKKLVSPPAAGAEWYEENFVSSISMLFVGQPASNARRLGILQSFLECYNRGHAFEVLVYDISWVFRLFYTNLKGYSSRYGLLLKLVLTSLTIPPIVLFAKSDKHGYRETDVKVTYILLWSTCLLEFLSWVPISFAVTRFFSVTWLNTVPQHNIISMSADRRRSSSSSSSHGCKSKLVKLASLISLELETYIIKHLYKAEQPESACKDIIKLVIDHVKDGWMLYIQDGTSYKRFNCLRGQWTMDRHKSCGWRLRSTLWLPFDQSVVIWHLATELCIHHCRSSQKVVVETSRCSRIISNYMIYLLFVCPEMLAPGTRQGLFMTACDEIDLMLKHVSIFPSWNQGSIAQTILRIAQFPWAYPENKMTSVLRACQLAEDLMEVLPDEKERWKVVQGVWVEMLCFSASRCRAYLHAKSMGDGVEFLTYVWLLLSDMGMETFADKFQGPDLEAVQEEEEATAAATSQLQLQVAYVEEEIV